MEKSKKQKLEAAGWKIGSAADFLDLSPDENSIIELRLALSDALKKQRLASNLTQESFAKLVGSSQSRIAKMEAGDQSVSLDLLIRSLFALGINLHDFTEILAAKFNDLIMGNKQKTR
jgi:DNA-binding XRE family transcriptional regulator